MEDILITINNEQYVLKRVVFKPIYAMKMLKDENLKPLSFEEILNLYVNSYHNRNYKIIKLLNTNNCDLRDGIIYNPDGRIKIDLDSVNLRNLNNHSIIGFSNKDKTKLNDKKLTDKIEENWHGSLNLKSDFSAFRFDEMPNEIKNNQLLFTQKEIKALNAKTNGTTLTITYNKKEKNPFFKSLVRGNTDLLNEYEEIINYNKKTNLKVKIYCIKPLFEAFNFLSLINSTEIDGSSQGRLDKMNPHFLTLKKYSEK